MKQDSDEPTIYWLPNMMTAGNLVCGFFAVLTIFQGILMATTKEGGYEFALAKPFYEKAILLIFASCVFDLLDGRLARLGGKESPFGREFDSLADVISFGMAPSMLMAKAVVFEIGDVGWWLACIYVLCGAIRLARFNCIAASPNHKPGDVDFRGLPIPMAAGFISSMTFLVIYFNEGEKNLGAWKWVLAGAMLGISLLMVSGIRYPSFKNIGWRTKGTPLIMVGVTALLIATVWYHYVMPAVLFSLYLLYGLMIRPFLPKRVVAEIEEAETGDEPE